MVTTVTEMFLSVTQSPVAFLLVVNAILFSWACFSIRLGHTLDSVTLLGVTPYHKLVEAFGGRGFSVEHPEDIRPALEAAFSANTVACVNVLTDPGIISPASIALGQLEAYKIRE